MQGGGGKGVTCYRIATFDVVCPHGGVVHLDSSTHSRYRYGVRGCRAVLKGKDKINMKGQAKGGSEQW